MCAAVTCDLVLGFVCAFLKLDCCFRPWSQLLLSLHSLYCMFRLRVCSPPGVHRGGCWRREPQRCADPRAGRAGVKVSQSPPQPFAPLDQRRWCCCVRFLFVLSLAVDLHRRAFPVAAPFPQCFPPLLWTLELFCFAFLSFPLLARLLACCCRSATITPISTDSSAFLHTVLAPTRVAPLYVFVAQLFARCVVWFSVGHPHSLIACTCCRCPASSAFRNCSSPMWRLLRASKLAWVKCVRCYAGHDCCCRGHSASVRVMRWLLW